MASTSVVTILACDVVESTAFMARVGDDAADEVRRAVFDRWRVTIAREGGVVVKTMGDGLMAVFRSSAVQAVAAALALRDSTAGVTGDSGVATRVGIATGEVSEEDDDWFGTPVVEAFRLCALADPGEILLSSVVRRVVGTRGGYEFFELGPMHLKGLLEPVLTYALVRDGEPTPRMRRTRRRPSVVAIGAAIVVLVVVAGTVVVLRRSTTHGASSTTPPIDAHALGYSPRLNGRACRAEETGGTAGVQCMTLIVPEDRDNPRGGSGRLPVVYVPARRPEALPEISVGRGAPPGAIDLSSVADQYLLTIRGDAGSQPSLSCKEGLDHRMNRLRIDPLQARGQLYHDLDVCRARLVAQGVNLQKYGPNDVADDMRDLALALHLSKIDARVFTDGAVPVYALLRRAPTLVHAILLNSPTPPDDTPFNEAGTAEAALENYGRRCSSDRTCNSIAPQFNSMVSALYKEWTAHPQSVTVRAPDGNQVRVLLDGDRLQDALWIAMHDNNAYGILAGAVASRDTTLASVYLALSYLGVGPALPNALEPDIRSTVWACQRRTDALNGLVAAAQRAFPRWRALIDQDGLDRCSTWQIKPRPDLIAAITGSTPTLIVVGDRSPEASIISRMQGALSASQLIELAGRASGDVNGWPACVPQLRRIFVLQPTRSLATEQCGHSGTPLEYVAAPSTIPQP